MIKVVGLQRSGTNYLTELLKENFKDDVAGYLYPFWKHSFPHETRVYLQNGKIFKQPKPHISGCRKILICKSFKHWFESVKRNPADLKQKRPEIFKENEIDIFEAEELYRDFMSDWSYFVDYTISYEYLISDFDKALKDIQRVFKLEPKGKFKDIKKVPHSKEFTEEKRKYYLDVN